MSVQGVNQPQLFAVEDAGPVPLPVPGDARGFDGLYTGLDLGVYSAFRTYEHRRFLDLEHHLARTRLSMQRLGWNYVLDEARLRRCLDRICTQAPFEEMRVRLDVLASPARVLGTSARELIALTPFTPPPRAIYEQGVAAVTTEAIRRDDPLTKRADFVARRKRIESATPGVYERLIVSPGGEILEGFSSNFYVVRDATLCTASEGVLQGVTRRIVLELAARAGVAVELRAPRKAELHTVQEAAISSSSRGLVPVVRIDGTALGGDGVPGPVIGELSAAYDAYVAGAIRPAVGDSS
jgi:branched-chain amino acid aminotransferase